MGLLVKLVCHIGIAEASAALIQDSLYQNAAWLRARGLHYADLLSPTPNHVTLTFACAEEVHRLAQDYGLHSQQDLRGFRQKLADHIAKQAGEVPSKNDTMIMSSAALTGIMRNPNEIGRLLSLFEPVFDDIKIFAYVRRQDDALLMRYSDLIRRGQTKERFEDFVETCLGDFDPMPHLDYRKSLAPWVQIFGRENIIVRRFSPTDFVHGDLLADVLGVVQRTWTPKLNGFLPAIDQGRMLGAPALEFVRGLHSEIPYFKDGKANPQRRALMPMINELPATPRPIMNAQTSRMIMGHYKASNTWLRDLFAPMSREPFFPKRDDHPEVGNMGRISIDQASTLAGTMLAKAASALR